MKILSIDKSRDPYHPTMIVEVTDADLELLSTGYSYDKSKAGDIISLDHARNCCKAMNTLSSTSYHLEHIESAIENMRNVAIELGLMKKENP